MQNASALKIPILTYHSIDESRSIISTAPEIFARQMKFLSESEYNAISLHDLIKIQAEKKSLPPKTIVLTFDDGFQNFYTKAFPILNQYGLSATVFLVTDFCEKYNDWAGNPPDLPRSKLLSWQQIRELSNFGIEFGAHTRTHPDLNRLAKNEVNRELVESKAIIEEKLGTEAATFAYPYGRFNSQVKQITQKTFVAACSTNLGKTQPNSDLHSLKRIDTYYLSNDIIFTSVSSKTFDYYLQFRQVLRKLKTSINQN